MHVKSQAIFIVSLFLSFQHIWTASFISYSSQKMFTWSHNKPFERHVRLCYEISNFWHLWKYSRNFFSGWLFRRWVIDEVKVKVVFMLCFNKFSIMFQLLTVFEREQCMIIIAPVNSLQFIFSHTLSISKKQK